MRVQEEITLFGLILQEDIIIGQEAELATVLILASMLFLTTPTHAHSCVLTFHDQNLDDLAGRDSMGHKKRLMINIAQLHSAKH